MKRSMRIAVFASGRGSNFSAIVAAERAEKLGGACVALLVSDNPQAGALARAKRARVPAIVLRPDTCVSRDDFERQVLRYLKSARIDVIVLAGFMRIIGPVLLSAYPMKILNIHPALLPAFKGAHPIDDAFAYGVKITGVTVHFVDAKMDHGPIISQEAVALCKNETRASLEARMHRLEHRLYPQSIRLLAAGKLRVHARQVTISSR